MSLNLQPFRQHQTPYYLYSESQLNFLCEQWKQHIPLSTVHLHFALKSNRNPLVLQKFLSSGFGIDVVSVGELKQGFIMGFQPENILFSGVAKTNEELIFAIKNNIKMLIVESPQELHRIQKICSHLDLTANVGLRINPKIDARTHPYISTGLKDHKFGIDIDQIPKTLEFLKSEKQKIKLIGLSQHIGSQIGDLTCIRESANILLEQAKTIRASGFSDLKYLDIGGGLAIDYTNPFSIPQFKEYGNILNSLHDQWISTAPDGKIFSECGRSLVGLCGFLVTKIIGIKTNGTKKFILTDAGMTELIRPALYQAKHPMALVKSNAASNWTSPLTETDFCYPSGNGPYTVAGPICESSDVFCEGIDFKQTPESNDYIVIGCAGAYGSVMNSGYNLRPSLFEYWSK